jgi:predicted DNA-binding transcriptional regulator AlpA
MLSRSQSARGPQPADSAHAVFLGFKSVRSLYADNASKSTLYDWIKAGLFPAPKRIGKARVAWARTELEEWAASRPRAGAAELPAEFHSDGA